MVIKNDMQKRNMFGGISSLHLVLQNVVKRAGGIISVLQIVYVQRASVELAPPGGTVRVEKVPNAKSARPTNRIPVVTMAKTVLYAVQPPLTHAVRGQRAKWDTGDTMKYVRRVHAKSA